MNRARDRAARQLGSLAGALLMVAACGGDEMSWAARDPAAAAMVEVDRFSATAGQLQVRTSSNGLPGPNQPVNFDQGPFITDGLGPRGERVRYYNFDVQPKQAADIFVLFKPGSATPVSGQLNIIDVIPGDAGYNDFWRVNKVTVPEDYLANAITSLAEIRSNGFAIEPTPTLVNCPVVPAGSTATLRLGGESPAIMHGWYRNKVVSYFTFAEAALSLDQAGQVPDADILVTFNRNPDPADAASGPASGFRTEASGAQTHNVVAAIPMDAGYSPLWEVSVYDNASFDAVKDLPTAAAARQLAASVAKVNCPIVSVAK